MRAKDAPVETAKFMGHGVCDNIAKSSTLSTTTDDRYVIFRYEFFPALTSFCRFFIELKVKCEIAVVKH